jgi:hypothetical protein
MVDDLDIAAADEEKEQEGGDKDDTGKGKEMKEESGILWTTLFSALPISDLTARAVTEMDYTRVTHVLPLPLLILLPQS